MDFAPYGNNNVVAMMRRMNYHPRMNLGRAVKKPTIQDLVIPIATPLFGPGYELTDDDLLEMEVKKMGRAKAKTKGLPCPPEPLKPYTPSLNGKFVKARESQPNDGDEEEGIAPSDDEDGSENKSDSSSDSNSNNSGHYDDDSNTNNDDNNRSYDSPYSGDDWGEPPSGREDEDADLFYEEYDSDMDYYDQDIEDDAEANQVE
ncbi:hypothetical protein SO802_026380 [Lithocarpus litseifolius]|uniref:Uncharacterized protein n=1 Tax=Lithocarpus litseifolius TaxID=425828 RepID=A0AAW2C4S3_9ROSI